MPGECKPSWGILFLCICIDKTSIAWGHSSHHHPGTITSTTSEPSPVAEAPPRAWMALLTRAGLPATMMMTNGQTGNCWANREIVLIRGLIWVTASVPSRKGDQVHFADWQKLACSVLYLQKISYTTLEWDTDSIHNSNFPCFVSTTSHERPSFCRPCYT